MPWNLWLSLETLEKRFLIILSISQVGVHIDAIGSFSLAEMVVGFSLECVPPQQVEIIFCSRLSRWM